MRFSESVWGDYSARKALVVAVGGADPQLIEGDVFRIVVKTPELGPTGERAIAPGVGTKPGLNRAQIEAQEAQSGAQSEAQSAAIVNALGSGPLSAAELVNTLGLKSKTGAFKRSLQKLLDKGLAEYTIPDKPNSRLQKYRLTEKGRQVSTEIQGEGEWPS